LDDRHFQWIVTSDTQADGAIAPTDHSIIAGLEETGLWLDPLRGPGISYSLDAEVRHQFDFKPADLDSVHTHIPFVRARFTDPDGFRFRAAYYLRQRPFAPLAARWVYDGQDEADTESLFIP
jgi:hypothetical protein